MWFRNRLVNPVVRLLLRSPLHPVLRRSLVILSYQGRKTGRWRSLPCLYARDGQDLYVVPGQAGRKVWWRNLRQPTRVRLRLQGRDREGIAAASSDPEAVAAGLRHYLARYPKAARPLRVRLDANGILHGRPPPPIPWSWSASTLTAANTNAAAARTCSASSPLGWRSNGPNCLLPAG